MEGKLLVVPAGSLDTEVHLRPTGHIFTDRKANWDENLEEVRKFPGLPK
jgi:hypothetical protein